MPGPDDTMRFLHIYAQVRGYTIPKDIDPLLLAKLKYEAEAIRHAGRGLDALLNSRCTPAQTTKRSPRVTTVADPNYTRFGSGRGTQ